jgi:hypothetical protein
VNTGAFVVYGGAGIAKNLYIGGTVAATSSSTGSLVLAGGMGIKGALYVGSTNNSTSTSTGGLVVTGGLGVKGSSYFGSNVAISGAITAGSMAIGTSVQFTNDGTKTYFQSGDGVYQDVRFTPVGTGAPNPYILGGLLFTVNPPELITNTTASTSITTGALVVNGGVGVGGAVYIGSTIAAVSTSTGALVVSGGIGVGDSIRSGTGIYPGNSNTGFSTYYADTFTYTPASGTFSGVTVTFTFTRIDNTVFCTFGTVMTTAAGASSYFSVTSVQLGTGSGGGTYTSRYAPNVGNESYITGLVYAGGIYTANSTYFANASMSVYANTALGNFNGLSNNGFVRQTIVYRMA